MNSEKSFRSKDIRAEVAVFAVGATAARGRWLGKGLPLGHVVHCGQGGARFGAKLSGHGEAEREVLRGDKDESGGNGLGEMSGHEKRISGELEQMIVVRPAGRVLEIDGITGIRRLNQQIEFSGNTKLTGKQ